MLVRLRPSPSLRRRLASALWAIALAAPAAIVQAAAPAAAGKSDAASADPERADAAAAAKAPAKVVVWGKLSSADGARSFALSGAEALVGSDKGCAVHLDDKTVAPQHARLSYRDGVIEVHDLGSRGGTLVAGTAVKPGKPFRLLQPVELTFGAVSLSFTFGERPDLIGPTQKARQPKAPTKGAPGKPAPGKAGKAK